MSFPQFPDYSKGQINRAGQALVSNDTSSSSVRNALEVVGKWRACHAYPINTFQATLRDKVRNKYNDPIVAQRLKRMPTIIDKLERYPEMQLARMQDIGGVRVVLKSVKDVNKLVDEYQSSRFSHKLVGFKDYITEPREDDGYRSVHLIYKYMNSRPPGNQYNGLLLELQVRTRLQHTWATAVETMGTLLGQALKSGRGEKEWLEFFALTSSAFAHMEKTVLIPKYAHLDMGETFRAVAAAEEELEVLDRIRSYSFAMERITSREDKKKWSYHLITLESLKNSIRIQSFGRDELKNATQRYTEMEERAAAGEKIESVLVSAGPMEELRRAYPNYFLDVSEFIRQVERMVKISQ